jgi:hypothetical protein
MMTLTGGMVLAIDRDAEIALAGKTAPRGPPSQRAG